MPRCRAIISAPMRAFGNRFEASQVADFEVESHFAAQYRH